MNTNFKNLRMTLFKSFFMFGLFLCIPFISLSQCENKLEYSYKKKSESLYVIYLKSDKQINSAIIQLYDLNVGKIVSEKNVDNLTSSETEVFTDVKQSTYSVIIRIAGCDKVISLGGIYGIVLENKQD